MTPNDLAGFILAIALGIVLLAVTGYGIWDAVTSHKLWLKEREAQLEMLRGKKQEVSKHD